VGFVIKLKNPEASALAIEVAHHLLTRGARGGKVVFATESRTVAESLKRQYPDCAKRVEVVEKAQLTSKADLIIVLGGDGTYLSIARLMRTRSVPVLGVNMGTLGFLTEIKRSELIDLLNDFILEKPALISERSLLEVTVVRKGKRIFQGPVVNDAVISKGAIARIIGMEISINGTEANLVRADGIIVSTPTGSTAYALAAGGPILEPSVPALILAPICPHSLTQRPLVVGDDSTIQIRLSHRPGHVLLTLDGQDAVDLHEGDLVTVKKFGRHTLQLICSPTRDYFHLLREKLNFGHRV
jgi:NAD+ kinase